VKMNKMKLQSMLGANAQKSIAMTKAQREHKVRQFKETTKAERQIESHELAIERIKSNVKRLAIQYTMRKEEYEDRQAAFDPDDYEDDHERELETFAIQTLLDAHDKALLAWEKANSLMTCQIQDFLGKIQDCRATLMFINGEHERKMEEMKDVKKPRKRDLEEEESVVSAEPDEDEDETEAQKKQRKIEKLKAKLALLEE